MNIYASKEIYDSRYDCDLESYFVFIAENSEPRKIKFVTQTHHILPKWAFPEYSNLKNNPWNCAILTHKNHLIAHFLLAKYWTHHNNSSAILKMCKKDLDFKDLKHLDILKFSDEYTLACSVQSKRCADMTKTRIFTQKTFEKSRQTKTKNGTTGTGFINAIEIYSGKKIRISTEEYHLYKDKYKTHLNGKEAWNKNIGPDNPWSGKLSVLDLETKTRIVITTEEFHLNKNKYFYRGSLNLKDSSLNKVPVINLETNETLQITKEKFNLEKDRYQHITAKLVWFNNGTKNLRLKSTDMIPDGYVKGRIKSQLKGHKKKTLTCPNCGKIGGIANMKRYHLSDCVHRSVP